MEWHELCKALNVPFSRFGKLKKSKKVVSDLQIFVIVMIFGEETVKFGTITML